MSMLGKAIGAGVIMAAIGHEMSLAREADKINAERITGEAEARYREQSARREGLQEMRGITDAQMQNQMMGAGVVQMGGGGRASRSVYMQELARRNSGRY